MKHFVLLVAFWMVFAELFATKTNSLYLSFPTESKFIHDLCFSSHGKVLVCTDNQSLKAFSMQDQKLLRNFEGGHRDKILSLDLSADSTLLVSGGADSLLVLRSFSDATIIGQLKFPNGKITDVQFSPDNRFVVAGSSGSEVYLIRVADLKVVHVFNEAQHDISSVAFSRAGDQLVTAGADKIIRIYNLNSLKLDASLRQHKSWIRSVLFINDDQNLISCSDDQTIYRWNLRHPGKTNRRIARSPFGWILTVDSTDDDERKSTVVAYGSMNGNVKIVYSFVTYTALLKAPVSKVLLLPKPDTQLGVVAATLGSGVFLIKALDMKMSD